MKNTRLIHSIRKVTEFQTCLHPSFDHQLDHFLHFCQSGCNTRIKHLLGLGQPLDQIINVSLASKLQFFIELEG